MVSLVAAVSSFFLYPQKWDADPTLSIPGAFHRSYCLRLGFPEGTVSLALSTDSLPPCVYPLRRTPVQESDRIQLERITGSRRDPIRDPIVAAGTHSPRFPFIPRPPLPCRSLFGALSPRTGLPPPPATTAARTTPPSASALAAPVCCALRGGASTGGGSTQSPGVSRGYTPSHRRSSLRRNCVAETGIHPSLPTDVDHILSALPRVGHQPAWSQPADFFHHIRQIH